ncbi:hypothetical protein FSARC_7179 [Fusarium sarcochroum]|uniref:Cytochrome P450 monooxygenase n=1 Tax=Fusarium sarcochroum TaxID=1208366 RepID=A0A8H4X7K8_9HYPO|nr:hypothetical protein FSARC_7179 [Fusarium sarcochroum]
MSALQVKVALAASALIAVSWLYSRFFRRPAPLDLPYLTFEDGDDSRQRHVTDTPALLQLGYDKYLKHGQAFAMRNYVNDDQPQVILPLKYLKEVRSAPESKLSFPYYSEQLFSLRYTGGIFHTPEATQLLRVDLNKHLDTLTPRMHEEAVHALEKTLPATSGPELAHNDEWIGLTSKITVDIMQAAQGVRAKWHPWIRWAAPWFFEPVKVVLASKLRAAQLLQPELEKRQSALDDSNQEKGKSTKFTDGNQWLLELYTAQGRKLTPEVLAHHQLFAAIGAIHTTVATIVGLLFDLLDNPQYLNEILEEIEQVRKESPSLPRQALNKLWKLESFMKESQRLHSVGQVRLNRAAVVPYTFKDGLHLPAGTQISFLLQVPNLDPDIHEDAAKFDPWRTLRKRQAESDKHHFATVADDNIFFGNGAHSCPGRFFATDEIKLILVHLFSGYDFKYATEGESRPSDVYHDNTSYPNVATQVLYKTKK